MRPAGADELIAQVEQASQLTELLAPFTVRRLLIRANVNPQRLDRAGVRKALPVFEEGLAMFLTPEELAKALAELRRLADSEPDVRAASHST